MGCRRFWFLQDSGRRRSFSCSFEKWKRNPHSPNDKIFCSWRNVKSIFIPKPGRTSYESAKSYRPISLTSIFLKTLERLRINQIEPTTRLTACLYQKAKSCEIALHYLVSRVETAIDRKIFAFGAFLDIEGAFDNKSFRAMSLACQEKRVHRAPTKWIKMLSHRIVSAEIRGIHSKRVVRKGCPQGGVLSPFLWNMVVDQLLRRLNEAHLWAQSFADDVVILMIGQFLNTFAN
jgi:Reverse transcriptase (RNA-dependent DNA polymerase)